MAKAGRLGTGEAIRVLSGKRTGSGPATMQKTDRRRTRAEVGGPLKEQVGFTTLRSLGAGAAETHHHKNN